jgi:hypothetical protein
MLKQIEKSAIILQKFWRLLRARRRLSEVRLFAQGHNFNELADLLSRGIPVISFVAEKSPKQLTLRLVSLIS